MGLFRLLRWLALSVRKGTLTTFRTFVGGIE